MRSIPASFPDIQAANPAARVLGHQSQVQTGGPGFGALLRQQALKAEEMPAESSSTRTTTAPDFTSSQPILTGSPATGTPVPPKTWNSAPAPPASAPRQPSGSPPDLSDATHSGTMNEFPGNSTGIESQKTGETAQATSSATRAANSPGAAAPSGSAMPALPASAPHTPSGSPPDLPEATHSSTMNGIPGKDAGSEPQKTANPARALSSPTPAANTSAARVTSGGTEPAREIHDHPVIPQSASEATPAASCSSSAPCGANEVPASKTESPEAQPLPRSGFVARPLPAQLSAAPGNAVDAVESREAASSGASVPQGEKKSETRWNSTHAMAHARSAPAAGQSESESGPQLTASTSVATPDAGTATAVCAAPATLPEIQTQGSLVQQPLQTGSVHHSSQQPHTAGGVPSEPPIHPQDSDTAAMSSEPRRAGEPQTLFRAASGAPASGGDASGSGSGNSTTPDHAAAHVFAADSQMHSAARPSTEAVQSAPGASTDLSAIHATSGIPAAGAAVSAPHSAPSAAGAAFERMDSAPAPQIIGSSPQRLAVGVRNSEMGWVEVHANRAAGQVSATVATGSVESHALLSAQLPSMREYLSAEHVRIDHLATENFPASSGHGEGFSGDRSRNGAGAQGSNQPVQIASSREDSGEADMDELSYINVRV